MKKLFALLSPLLVAVGLKAQTPTTPVVVKKETVKPVIVKPAVVDTAVVKPGATIKQAKAIKFDHIKKEVTVKMKETPVAKPHKD